MDRLAEAERLFLDALARQETGDLEQAKCLYQEALALAPERPSVMNNLAAVYIGLKKFPEARLLCERLLEVNPEDEAALVNFGNCQLKLGSTEEALRSYEKALRLKPDCPEALCSLGGALLELERPQEALESCDRALALKPDYAEALDNRGTALLSLDRYEELVECYSRLLEIKPDYDYARGHLLHAQMHYCQWAAYDKSAAQISEGIRAGRRVDTPFSFLAVSESAADLLRCSRIFVSDKYPATARPLWRGERYRDDRIRLAYLSADFREHPSSFLLAGLFERHDRGRFETIGISFGDDDQSEIRTRVKGAFERFIDVRTRNDWEVARLLRELEVDIAVDLMGHTQYSRMGIFALRPAPLQVNFFCPGTSGADYLDYIVCDRIVIPEDHHVHYSEKVVYLPDTFQANDSKRRIAEYTPSRAEVGLPDAGFVFCSFNQPYKFTPRMFDIWMQLLRRVAGSVLWLQNINATASKNLRREAARRGIDANRLVFAPRVPRLEDHLARYRLADLFLDTLPYNAQTTASDALWAGLPVLTCLGRTFVGRVAASLLNAIGLPELVTRSLPEYEALALKLATQPEVLADIKANLAHNRERYPLFDTDRFRRHIESAYITMWERQQRGEPPASFAVPELFRVGGAAGLV